jgi:hypothetical protein
MFMVGSVFMIVLCDLLPKPLKLKTDIVLLNDDKKDFEHMDNIKLTTLN